MHFFSKDPFVFFTSSLMQNVYIFVIIYNVRFIIRIPSFNFPHRNVPVLHNKQSIYGSNSQINEAYKLSSYCSRIQSARLINHIVLMLVKYVTVICRSHKVEPVF